MRGIRRRSAASASPARVNSFSLTSSSSRADCHSCGETIGGIFIESQADFDKTSQQGERFGQPSEIRQRSASRRRSSSARSTALALSSIARS